MAWLYLQPSSWRLWVVDGRKILFKFMGPRACSPREKFWFSEPQKHYFKPFWQKFLPLQTHLLEFKVTLNNGNRTEWSRIRSVIIRVINKIRRPRSGVRFVYIRYDYRQIWLHEVWLYYQLIVTITKLEKNFGKAKRVEFFFFRFFITAI